MVYSTSSKKKMIHIVSVLLFSCMFFSHAALALEIKVKEEASIRGEIITLGDIAEFSPPDDKRISLLKDLEISASPAPGKISRINKKLLIYRIGTVVTRYDDITVKVPEDLYIQRTAQILDSKKIKAIFSEYIINNSPYDRDNILITRVNTPGGTALPEGKLSWNIREKDYPNKTGNVSLTLDLFVDGKLIRRLSVSGVIMIKREIVESARQIGKGEIITREDLALVMEESMRPDNDIFTDVDDVLGKRAVRNIRAGSPMAYGWVESPPIVKKGTPVLIKAENDIIKITTRGKVLEDGRAGEQIKVVNISSGKEIYAVVKGPGLVEVNF